MYNAGDIVATIYIVHDEVILDVCAIYIHLAIALDVCHAGTTEDITLQVTALQRDQGIAAQFCLIAAAIYILINSACLDGDCAVAEDVGMFTVACAEQTAVDGSCPVNLIDRSANICWYSADSILYLNLGAAIGTTVLSATEHGADCTAIDGHISSLGCSGRG